MNYLFGFIQKDKQAESLVEKLCQRFRMTLDVQQWRNFAYCLSLVKYTDKCVRKLTEQFACFHDKLSDPEIYNCFTEIISKARSFAKIEMKDAIAELEAKIAECHQKGAADEEAVTNATKAKKRAQKRVEKAGSTAGATGKAKRSTRQKAQQESESEGEDEGSDAENEEIEEDEEQEEAPARGKKSAAPSKGKKAGASRGRSAVDENTNPNSVTGKGRGGKAHIVPAAAPVRRRRKVQVAASDEDEDLLL